MSITKLHFLIYIYRLLVYALFVVIILKLFSIFSRDLLTICRQLNLEDSVDDLMKELGADKTGRISFDEFVRRRLELRTEINALRIHNYDPLPEYLPTSSENSLGILSTSIYYKY